MPVPIDLMHFKEKSLGDPNKGGLNSTAMFINGILKRSFTGNINRQTGVVIASEKCCIETCFKSGTCPHHVGKEDHREKAAKVHIGLKCAPG